VTAIGSINKKNSIGPTKCCLENCLPWHNQHSFFFCKLQTLY